MDGSVHVDWAVLPIRECRHSSAMSLTKFDRSTYPLMRHTQTSLLFLQVTIVVVLGSCKKNDPEAPIVPHGGGPSSVMDIDGNIYPVVVIGEQQWMAKSLRTTRFRDGSLIPHIMDNDTWSDLFTNVAWCNYENSDSIGAIYGKLYNWYAAANPNICPYGWHVPSDDEWQQLEQALGMDEGELDQEGWRGEEENIGGKMKSTSLWNAPNTGGTNEIGFSALPHGFRGDDEGWFHDLGVSGSYWSTSELAWGAWARYLRFDKAGINRLGSYRRTGSCIRCIKD
jgi:uncharacterized protein (TIGR02145 family)